MKILAFSGFHGNRDLINILIKSILDKNLNPDLFVCAGDIGDSIAYELFIKLKQFGKPILYVLGNHTLLDSNPDELKKLKKLKNIFHLDKRNLELNGFIFVGQDAYTHFAIEREEHRHKHLKKKLQGLPREKTILITHHAPLGILDRGISYPQYSWVNDDGNYYGGSLSIRKITERFKPYIHIFAHMHTDGGRWSTYNNILFANVCHLERKNKNGEIGINGGFMLIDTKKMICIPHHLTCVDEKKCECDNYHYLNYRKCINCYNLDKKTIDFNGVERLHRPNLTGGSNLNKKSLSFPFP